MRGLLRLALTPRWIAGLLLAVAFATGFMMLSRWQLGAADQGQIIADPAKEHARELTEVVTPLSPVFAEEADSKVIAHGHYDLDSVVIIESRVHDGRQGWWSVARFIPDEQPEAAEGSVGEPYSIGVARWWAEEPEQAAAAQVPEGELWLAGRLVANEAPVPLKDGPERIDAAPVIGSAATAQLTNVWDAPLYAGIVTAEAEAGERSEALAEDETVRPEAAPQNPGEGLEEITTRQVTDESLDWLNVFYAVEWLVFAGFAFYLWGRMLVDARRRETAPERYVEVVPNFEGRYFYEEQTGQYFYYDPQEDQYFYFDDQQTPAAGPDQGCPTGREG